MCHHVSSLSSFSLDCFGWLVCSTLSLSLLVYLFIYLFFSFHFCPLCVFLFKHVKTHTHSTKQRCVAVWSSVSNGRVLLGARPSVPPVVHLQVQGDGRRSPATPITARMPQRLPTRRSSTQVSIPSHFFQL